MFRSSALLLLLAVGVSAASLEQNGVLRVQLKQGKQAGHVSAIRSFLKQSGGVNQTLIDEQNINYQGEIHVGTPNQTLTVDFDTGSPDLWLVIKGCKAGWFSACESPHKYDPKKSKTSHDTGEKFEIFYGSGQASGKLFTDTVGLTIDPKVANLKNFTFGGAKHLEGMPSTFDGLFGLSFATKENPHAFIKALADQKVFKEPVFTIWLDSQPDDIEKFAGEIIFGGGEDSERCGKVITTTESPVLKTDTWWTFKIDDIHLGGESLGTNHTGVTDTGTTKIIVSPELYEKLAAKHPILKNSGGFECAEASEQLKDFRLELKVNNETLVLDANDAVIKTKDLCISAFGAMGGQPFDLLLGDPFIRKYCQVHNYEKRTLGFAPAKSSKPSSL